MESCHETAASFILAREVLRKFDDESSLVLQLQAKDLSDISSVLLRTVCDNIFERNDLVNIGVFFSNQNIKKQNTAILFRTL
jgi:hypothetical protein